MKTRTYHPTKLECRLPKTVVYKVIATSILLTILIIVTSHPNLPPMNSATGTTRSKMTSEATTRTPAEQSFEKLQLFASAYPGNLSLSDNDYIGGFAELESTLIRTLQFFWPKDKFQMTVVLDDTSVQVLDDDHNGGDDNDSTGGSDHDSLLPSSSEEQRRQMKENKMTSFIKSMFHQEDYAPHVSVRYNPRSNTTLFGKGWFMQQLIMFWADNFTDSEFIGFVDDDTIFTRLVHADELFDDQGRPRAIVQHALRTPSRFVSNTYEAFGGAFPTIIYAMVFFPVVIKRDHLKNLREFILNAQPPGKFNCFDDYFQHVVRINRQAESENWEDPHSICQFCIMLDYAFHFHKDEYSWHFEESESSWGRPRSRGEDSAIKRQMVSREVAPHKNGVTLDMLEPLPRVAIHASYLFSPLKMLRTSKTKAGRRPVVSGILREGYCHSQPLVLQEHSDATIQDYRCTGYYNENNVYPRGEWRFEQTLSDWWHHNKTAVDLAYNRSRQRNPIFHEWNEEELDLLF